MTVQHPADNDMARVCPLDHAKDPERARAAAPDSALCNGHILNLTRTLEELATFDTDADAHTYDGKLAGHSAPPLTGTGEKPLPIDPRTAELRVDVRATLAGWCSTIAEARKVTGPPVPLSRLLAAFLTKHLDWALGQDWIADFATEMYALGRRVHGLFNPSGRRQFEVGLCVETVDGKKCPGVLWALLTPADPVFMAENELCCDTCGVRIPSHEWLSYGRKVRRDTAA